MRSYRYFHLDVFTASLFGGNQLAVFLDGRGLTTEDMQAIAKEMNFSETTFILPPERDDTDTRMRIFTPAAELALAGHPTIGSTFALARAGVIAPGRSEPFVFGLGVGPIPVSLSWSSSTGTSQLKSAFMSQPVPKFSPAAKREHLTLIADALHISGDDLDGKLPVQIGSAGLSFLYVALTTREAVDRSRLDYNKLKHFYATAGIGEAKGCFVFTAAPSTARTDTATVYSRMFAPNLGIEEDPATGSASGPLGCHLVLNHVVPPEKWGQIVNLQGVKMGRASTIHIAITTKDGATADAEEAPEITKVVVGGESVVAGEGTIFLP